MSQNTHIELEPKDYIFLIKSLYIQFTPQFFQRCLYQTISFNGGITPPTKRPVMLFFGGCTYNLNGDIIKKTIEINIILVPLPENATHETSSQPSINRF